MTTTTPTLIETIFETRAITPDYYHLGELTYGSPVEVLSVKFSELPAEVRQLITERDGAKHNAQRFTLAFYNTPCPGQTSTGTPNWTFYIAPSYSTPRQNRDTFIIGRAGCQHDMESTNLGRCYNRYTCKKCGYSYSVDSGD